MTRFESMQAFLPNTISTARLALREPSLADAATIFHAYAQDDEVCRFMIWTPHRSEATTQAFVESCRQAWRVAERLPYVITEHDSDRAIGMIEARVLGTTIDIGYVLAKRYWGKGYMPEAITALANAALASPGVYRVHAACDTENTASQRALEKSGFVREGRLERYTIHPNIAPEPRACFMYARCR